MTVRSESPCNGNGRTAADGSADRVARVRHHLEGMGLGDGTIGDIVAMLRKYGAIGRCYLLSARGADRVNAAWSGEAESHESIIDAYRRGSAYVAARMGEADSLDALADELSGATARGDDLSDDVLAAVLADLVPRKASPEALIRALALALKSRKVFLVADEPDGPRFLAWGPAPWNERTAAEWAKAALSTLWTTPDAPLSPGATSDQPRPSTGDGEVCGICGGIKAR